MLGCQEQAELAYAEKQRGGQRYYCGQGSFRHAYHIEELVYKVCGQVIFDPINIREHAFFVQFSERSWAPEVALYHVDSRPIVCMPYIEYNHNAPVPYDLVCEAERCLVEYIDSTDARCFTYSGFGDDKSRPDVRAHNYRIDNEGHFWLVDAGGS